MKTILAITGTRADYGIFRPVFRAIQQEKNLHLEVLVTGMHLLPEFGITIEEIRRDGFPIVAEISTMTSEDTKTSMAEFVGRTTIACAKVFEQRKPDCILVLGDRGEQLAAATAATYLTIPVLQLHAGERSGSVDDAVRFAISALATIHCTSTEADAKRLRLALGTRGKNVHCTGAPALDTITSLAVIPKEKLLTDIGLPTHLPLCLFLQHPDTLDALSPEAQLQSSISALENFDGCIVIFGSNADAGGTKMNRMLKDVAQKKNNTKFLPSVPHTTYLSWLAAADVLVGNSSSGIIEAASFHLPVVNIGDRQQGRTRSGNVIDVPYASEAIAHAMKKALTNRAFLKKVRQCKNVYGDGHTAGRIVEILRRYGLDSLSSSR